MYNLPEKVVFCDHCVQSNHRPSSIPEFLHTPERKNAKYLNVEKDKEHFNVDTHEKLYRRLTAGSDWILPFIKEYLTKHNLTFKKGFNK